MGDSFNIVLLCLVGIFVGFVFGISQGHKLPGKDCDTLGKFRASDVVYICHREK